MFNIFRALLCPSSGARDYMCVITAYGVQCLVAGCRGSDARQQAVRPGRGLLHDCSRVSGNMSCVTFLRISSDILCITFLRIIRPHILCLSFLRISGHISCVCLSCGYPPTPNHRLWRRSHNLELDPLQNRSTTPYRPPLYTGRLDNPPLFPVLAPPKAGGNIMDLS